MDDGREPVGGVQLSGPRHGQRRGRQERPPVFTPTDNVETFKNALAVSGVTPTADHAGAFAILLEPIAAGAMGRAIVSGVTPVKVNITNADHRYAEVEAGQAGYLASAESGSALLLWKEAGTGEKWALVRMGNPGSAGAAGPVIVCAVKDALGDATYTGREEGGFHRVVSIDQGRVGRCNRLDEQQKGPSRCVHRSGSRRPMRLYRLAPGVNANMCPSIRVASADATNSSTT